MTVQLPTDDQMNRLIDARLEHSRNCDGIAPFEVFCHEITMKCSKCGWFARIEVSITDDD